MSTALFGPQNRAIQHEQKLKEKIQEAATLLSRLQKLESSRAEKEAELAALRAQLGQLSNWLRKLKLALLRSRGS